jgi:4'-phosphopantetheinyl transferase
MAEATESGLQFRICPFSVDLGTATPHLDTQEVHVWYVPLEPSYPGVEGLQNLLSADEAERAARFHFEKHRAQYTLTRGSLRLLLGSYLQRTPQEIAFEYSDHGKPSVSGHDNGQKLNFNLSHTEGMAIFGFTRGRRIGVDIESLRADFQPGEIAERFFSPVERAGLSGILPADRHEIFFRIWTRKEAYIKAIGEGLSHPLHQFDVSLDEAALVATRPDASEARRWQLRNLDIAPGFTAAAAVESGGAGAPAR